MGRKAARAEKGHGTGQHAECSILLVLFPDPEQVLSFLPSDLGPHSPMGTIIPMTAAVTVEPILPPSFPSAKHKHLQDDVSHFWWSFWPSVSSVHL